MTNIALLLEEWRLRPLAISCARNAALVVMWVCNSNGRRQLLAVVHFEHGRIVRALLDIVGHVVPGDLQWGMSAAALGNIFGRSMHQDLSVVRVLAEARGGAALLERLRVELIYIEPNKFEALGPLV